VEALLLTQAEEKGDLVLRKRSPRLRAKTKDYYENGWRLTSKQAMPVGLSALAVAQ